MAKDAKRDAVIVAGNRTPFMKSNGAFKNLMSHDLGRHAVTCLLYTSDAADE